MKTRRSPWTWLEIWKQLTGKLRRRLSLEALVERTRNGAFEIFDASARTDARKLKLSKVSDRDETYFLLCVDRNVRFVRLKKNGNSI